jgi:multisubunit Na+/H+ antiporter MnhB subunit
VLIGVIVFIAALVLMAIVYYVVRVRRHPDEICRNLEG